MPTIGIDLGTTFSAAAILGEYEGRRFARHGDVSIIRDEHERYTIPSVIALGSDGKIIVGHRAKARAGMTPGPIMFAKRAMGREHTFTLGDRQMSAEEVSACILRHIKHVASEALGEEVERAVITVPAWFNLMAKTQTRRAGELAGLDVAWAAPEPVAAALAYFGQPGMEDDGPQTILTYDLGGGTFDAAVVSRVTGVPEVLSSCGDPHLGGHDFDKRLALWIARKLAEQGYVLELDPEDENDPVLARLMVLAERVKIDLSSKPVAVLCEPNTGLVDDHGAPVTIDLEIERAEFNDMIEELVTRSIQLTRQALKPDDEEAIAPEEIDAIIMVGGSSRIPLVTETLEREFGKTPRLMDPDLCVAIGAALLAAAEPEVTPWSRLDRPAEETEQASVQVTGSVLQGEPGAAVSGWRVALARADGGYSEERTSLETGAFVFPQAAVEAGQANEFTLTGFDPDGNERFSHHFTVRQTDTPRAVGVTFVPETNRLAMPLVVETSEGPYVVARAGTALPFTDSLTAETTAPGIMRVPVKEGDTTLGECLVENIPPDVTVGSLVQLDFEITRNYEVRLRAFLPAIAEEAEMPPARLAPPPRKTLEELQAEFAGIRVRASDVMTTAEPGVLFEGGRGERIETLVNMISDELESGHADRDRTQNLTSELHYLLEDMTAGWQPDPPRQRYESLVKSIRKVLKEAAEVDETVNDYGWGERFAALCEAAEEAFTEKSDAAWRRAIEELEEMQAQLGSIAEGPRRERTPGEWILVFGEHLRALRPAAEDQGLEDALKQCADILRTIKADDPRAIDQLAELYQDYIEPLERKLKAGGMITDDDDEGLIRVTGGR